MENNSLQLDHQAIEALRESAKWSMFLAIMGFIGVGLMVIAAIFMGSVFAMIPDTSNGMGYNPIGAMKGFITILYLVLAGVYFFPVYYLYKYASGMKNALNFRNSNLVSNAFVSLKQHHKILGIMIIVLISLYVLFIIGIMFYAFSVASSGSVPY